MLKLLLVSSAVLIAFVGASGNPFEDCEEEAKCPPGYTFKERKDNRGWCLKYFAGNYTFFEAERICRCQGGATLSGLENTGELIWVLEQAQESFEETGIKNGGVWVGAYRRPSCSGDPKKWEKKPECSKLLQFQWTDRNTRGTEMWDRWMEGSPHNNIIGNHSESCVQLQVSIEPQGTANKNLTGTFDNRVCIELPADSTFATEGFVCGRPPKFGNGGYSGPGGEVIIIGEGKPTEKP